MRLLRLDLTKDKWILEDFSGPRVPFYAVLSHTWGHDADEVKFEDIESGDQDYDATSKKGFDKLRFCHKQVQRDGLQYFWVDTCCIKKTDSSELQRSLASMFYWYQRAIRCYVLLSDVSEKDLMIPSESERGQALGSSRWFKRGWTLQELIAPQSVMFFTKDSVLIGTKIELASTISRITRIPKAALTGTKLSQFSVTERLSWADGRVTTLPEDGAYCLIGIFDVEMHMLYAEDVYNKRKNIAMNKLHRAIAESTNHENQVEDVTSVGGASLRDLLSLNEEKLEKFDKDLDSFQTWLLDGFATEIYPQRFGDGDSMTKLSQEASRRMKNLLTKYRVKYSELTSSEYQVDSWRPGWTQYRDKRREPPNRIRGLMANRLHWMREREDCFIGVTAFRTLEALMIWRGKWDPNVEVGWN